MMNILQRKLNTKSHSQIRSYVALRKAVGWIGISLPIILAVGRILLEPENTKLFEESISHYYHTGMRDVFVGSMFAVALFLFFYNGPTEADNIVGNIAALSAVGVALFRTTPAFLSEEQVDGLGTVHFICAGLFFTCLIIFSLYLFPRGNRNEEETEKRKRVKRRIFYTCGLIMISAVLTIAIYIQFFDNGNHLPIVFWGEFVALIAFGFSWLTNGSIKSQS